MKTMISLTRPFTGEPRVIEGTPFGGDKVSTVYDPLYVNERFVKDGGNIVTSTVEERIDFARALFKEHIENDSNVIPFDMFDLLRFIHYGDDLRVILKVKGEGDVRLDLTKQHLHDFAREHLQCMNKLHSVRLKNALGDANIMRCTVVPIMILDTLGYKNYVPEEMMYEELHMTLFMFDIFPIITRATGWEQSPIYPSYVTHHVRAIKGEDDRPTYVVIMLLTHDMCAVHKVIDTDNVKTLTGNRIDYYKALEYYGFEESKNVIHDDHVKYGF